MFVQPLPRSAFKALPSPKSKASVGNEATRNCTAAPNTVVDFLPKAKIELAVDDAIVEQVIEAITNTARTGKIGDGKIFVTELIEAIRIRTGETGSEAV